MRRKVKHILSNKLRSVQSGVLYRSGLIADSLDKGLYRFFAGVGEMEIITVENAPITYRVTDSVEWDLAQDDEAEGKGVAISFISENSFIRKIRRWILVYLEWDDIILTQSNDIQVYTAVPEPKKAIFTEAADNLRMFKTFLAKYYSLISKAFLSAASRIAGNSKSPIFRRKPDGKLLISISRNHNYIRGPSFRRILYFAPLIFWDDSSSYRSKWPRGIKPLQDTSQCRAQGQGACIHGFGRHRRPSPGKGQR